MARYEPPGRPELMLATASDDGTTRLWDVPSGRPIGTVLPGLAQHDAAAMFVDGGTHLVTLHDNGGDYLWEIRPEIMGASGLRGCGSYAHMHGVERRAA